jgi:stalled ribosome rescue protein Dom34
MIALPACIALSLLCVQNHAGRRKELTVKHMVTRIVAPTVNFVKNQSSIRHNKRGVRQSEALNLGNYQAIDIKEGIVYLFNNQKGGQ